MLYAGTDFGTLLMPSEKSVLEAATELAWDDFLVTRILISVATVFAVFVLKDIFRITPALMRCVSKYQGCISIEKNMQESRTRDLVLWACILPYALMTGRYGFSDGPLGSLLPLQWRALGMVVAVGGFEFMRTFFYTFFRYRGLHNDSARIAKRNLRNFFIVATSIMFLTACLVRLAGIGDGAARLLMTLELAAVYSLFIVRQFQIFVPHHSRFTTFLYLCGLEILPILILVAIIWAL